MTEQEWLSCTDPHPMLDYVALVSDLRNHLLIAACFRRVWNLLPHEHSRQAIEFLEGDAPHDYSLSDALRTSDEAVHESPCVASRIAARAVAEMVKNYQPLPLSGSFDYPGLKERTRRQIQYPKRCVEAITNAMWLTPPEFDCEDRARSEQACQCSLVREIFGNPFRPVVVDPAWLTWGDGTVVKLAQATYEERALPSGELDRVRLNVLADALEEAGCANGDIVEHLRSPGPHVRGCWVIDLLLGKE